MRHNFISFAQRCSRTGARLKIELNISSHGKTCKFYAHAIHERAPSLYCKLITQRAVRFRKFIQFIAIEWDTETVSPCSPPLKKWKTSCNKCIWMSITLKWLHTGSRTRQKATFVQIDSKLAHILRQTKFYDEFYELSNRTENRRGEGDAVHSCTLLVMDSEFAITISQNVQVLIE